MLPFCQGSLTRPHRTLLTWEGTTIEAPRPRRGLPEQRVRALVLALCLFWGVAAHADPARELSEGNALKQVDACEEALVHYDAALATAAPGDGIWEAATYNRAVCLELLDRLDEAIAGYSDVVRRSPSTPAVNDALFRRGLTHTLADDPRRARADFTRSRRRVKDEAARRRIDVQLGTLYAVEGRTLCAVQKLGPVVVGLREEVVDAPGERYYLAQSLVGLGDLHRRDALAPVPRRSFKRLIQELGGRAEALATAQAFYVEAAQQQQPTWTAAATLHLGDAYIGLVERLEEVASNPGRLRDFERLALSAWIDGRLPDLRQKARDAYRLCADVFTETGLDDRSTRACRQK